MYYLPEASKIEIEKSSRDLEQQKATSTDYRKMIIVWHQQVWKSQTRHKNAILIPVLLFVKKKKIKR